MNTMVLRAGALASILFLARVVPVAAQNATVGAFGLGWGQGTITCTMCSSNGTYDGVTLRLSYGKTVNRHLRALFDYAEWSHLGTSGGGVTGSDWEKDTEDFTASLEYFPWTVRHGFFLEGGLGLTVAKVWVTDTTGLRRHGWGVKAGIGYDLFPTHSISVAPTIAFSYGSIGSIYYPLGSSTLWAAGWKHEVVSAGLDLTFHHRSS